MENALPYAIRLLTEQDIPEMQELFRSTVLTVSLKDYTKEEVEDWASCGDSREHLKALLSKHNFIAALDNKGLIIGFSSMNFAGYLHSHVCSQELAKKRCGDVTAVGGRKDGT